MYSALAWRSRTASACNDYALTALPIGRRYGPPPGTDKPSRERGNGELSRRLPGCAFLIGKQVLCSAPKDARTIRVPAGRRTQDGCPCFTAPFPLGCISDVWCGLGLCFPCNHMYFCGLDAARLLIKLIMLRLTPFGSVLFPAVCCFLSSSDCTGGALSCADSDNDL